MFYLLLLVLVVALIYGPQCWVGYVLRRHSRELPGMPGTGGELAQHLIDRFELEGVTLEQTEQGDHYDPEAQAVRLSAAVYTGKSLTAVATAAHEVGHAIAFHRQEPVTQLRSRYLGSALRWQRFGATLMVGLPILAAIFKIPHVVIIAGLIGLSTMLISVFMYAAILPEEWDASFNKALPILYEGEYLPEQYHGAVRQILTACALTYVAAALADMLRLWRWIAILKAGR